jgi:hypothetical protein
MNDKNNKFYSLFIEKVKYLMYFNLYELNLNSYVGTSILHWKLKKNITDKMKY